MNAGNRQLRILVVEDEPLIGMEIESTVEQLGHQVIGPVAELADALALAADCTIDCAMLDINIRGGKSYAVVEMLLNRNVPVLLLTGYGAQTLPERLQEQIRLPKPFTSDTLEEEIDKLCARVLRPGQYGSVTSTDDANTEFSGE